MKRAGTFAVATGLVVAGTVGARLYQHRLQPRMRDWGASPEEITQPLPGDELIPVDELQGATTRAITIDAPPSAVWPWLAQMGQGRGGAYTYDWIENLLGLEMHSADHIIPDLQHPSVGDVLLHTPERDMLLQAIEPEHTLVASDPDHMWSWAFSLEPLAEGRTRFISRNRFRRQGPRFLQPLYGLVMEPASLVMERKMLLGIKQRAERTHAPLPADQPQRPAADPVPVSTSDPVPA